MEVWIGVVAVAAASLAIRLLPFLAAQRFALPDRAADALRHAGAGALTALIVLAVIGSRGSGPDAAVVVGVAVSALAARRGWSTTRVVLAGGGTYAAAVAVLALL
jgi:branched-subunit amino acid transport protein